MVNLRNSVRLCSQPRGPAAVGETPIKRRTALKRCGEYGREGISRC